MLPALFRDCLSVIAEWTDLSDFAGNFWLQLYIPMVSTACAAVQPRPAVKQLIPVADNVVSADDFKDAGTFATSRKLRVQVFSRNARQAHTQNTQASGIADKVIASAVNYLGLPFGDQFLEWRERGICVGHSSEGRVTLSELLGPPSLALVRANLLWALLLSL